MKNAAYGSRCYNCGDDWANAKEVPPSKPPEDRPRDLRAEGDDLRCPGCDGFLESAQAPNRSASLKGSYGCRRCGGVWLDNAASQLVVRGIDPSIVAFASIYALGAVKGPKIESAPRICPIGLEPLATVSVKGVVIDACRTHGTWFDAGELRRIAERRELPASVRHVVETIAGPYRSSGR
jgi:Zn-finger nucleic acid-binding protein